MKLGHLAALEKHLESAGGERLLPIYLLIGKDHPEAMEGVRAIFSKTDREVVRYSGEKLTPDTLAQELDSISLFSPKRLLFIDRADKAKNPVKDLLLSFLTRSGEPMIVLAAETFLPQSKLYKAIESLGAIVHLDGGKPWEMEPRRIEWLLEWAKKEGKRLDTQMAKALVKRVGTGYSALSREVEKLFCYVGEGGEITLQAIEAITLKVDQETVWQLGDALLAKNSPQAISASKTLERAGTPFIMTLRALRKQYSNRLLQQSNDSVKKGLVAIDAAELRAKNSNSSESLIMDLLIAELLR